MAESDYADVFKQLPLRGGDEYAAAATLRNLEVREFYGFIFKTRHFVAVAAVLRYTSFSSLRASLVCPLLKLPFVGFFDYCGVIALLDVKEEALDASTKHNGVLRAQLKRRKSEAGARKLSFRA